MNRLMAMLGAAIIAVGCTSQKVPAEMALKGVESALSAATPEIQKLAGDELAGLTDGMAAAKQKFEAGDYAGVIADAQSLTSKVADVAKMAADKKVALTSEWGTFASLPAAVGQITAKLTELGAMRRLPAGLDKTKLDGAKASLESVNKLWADASAAFSSGDLVAAVAKAKDVKPMVDGLMSTLSIAAAASK